MKKYKLGYTQGTFDMFHIGHLNLLRSARLQCEKLIVGVNSDELVLQYKNKTPVINENDRREIISELRSVDDAIVCKTLDKTIMHKKLHFDAIFIGDDWKGNPRWNETEKELSLLGVTVIYLKHTDGISSTILRAVEPNRITDRIQ